MLNRSALIVRCKQPFVDWINAAAPGNEKMTLAEVNDDGTVYLFDAEDDEDLDVLLKENAERIFAAELSSWILDENLWPKNLSVENLKKWFDFDWHSVVVDMGRTAIEDDEAESDEDYDDDDDYEDDNYDADDEEDDMADPGKGRR